MSLPTTKSIPKGFLPLRHGDDENQKRDEKGMVTEVSCAVTDGNQQESEKDEYDNGVGLHQQPSIGELPCGKVADGEEGHQHHAVPVTQSCILHQKASNTRGQC